MPDTFWHKLQLKDKLESHGNKEVGCWLWKKPIFGSRSYECGECNFFLHESCPEPTDKIKIEATHDLRNTHHLISSSLAKHVVLNVVTWPVYVATVDFLFTLIVLNF
jgi:hypothetical protein